MVGAGRVVELVSAGESVVNGRQLSASAIRDFRDVVYEYFRANRRLFPWRDPSDPYDILVSEVMLQQTQADRVVPKYREFVRVFPTISALASASAKEVLALWQGLGYNRRAVMLKRAAEAVVADYGGVLPTEEAELVKLPGVGPYTASAIAAFAGNRPTVVIETNIRSVYIHHFFGDREGVRDAEIVPLIEQTLDSESPREWYSALMDYGAMLKKTGVNPNRRSAHYVRQGTFEGSSRQLRGQIVKALLERPASPKELARRMRHDTNRLSPALEALRRDGLVTKSRSRYAIA